MTNRTRPQRLKTGAWVLGAKIAAAVALHASGYEPASRCLMISAACVYGLLAVAEIGDEAEAGRLSREVLTGARVASVVIGTGTAWAIVLTMGDADPAATAAILTLSGWSIVGSLAWTRPRNNTGHDPT